MKLTIKLVVVILLLVCLADMPYGFYQMVRFVAMAAFAYLSYDYFKAKQEVYGVIFALLALLFQPFFKIALGRTIWNIIDIIVAIGLICLIIRTIKGKNEYSTK